VALCLGVRLFFIFNGRAAPSEASLLSAAANQCPDTVADLLLKTRRRMFTTTAFAEGKDFESHRE